MRAPTTCVREGNRFLKPTVPCKAEQCSLQLHRTAHLQPLRLGTSTGQCRAGAYSATWQSSPCSDKVLLYLVTLQCAASIHVNWSEDTSRSMSSTGRRRIGSAAFWFCCGDVRTMVTCLRPEPPMAKWVRGTDRDIVECGKAGSLERPACQSHGSVAQSVTN
jgi:hypothetical protein